MSKFAKSDFVRSAINSATDVKCQTHIIDDVLHVVFFLDDGNYDPGKRKVVTLKVSEVEALQMVSVDFSGKE